MIKFDALDCVAKFKQTTLVELCSHCENRITETSGRAKCQLPFIYLIAYYLQIVYILSIDDDSPTNVAQGRHAIMDVEIVLSMGVVN